MCSNASITEILGINDNNLVILGNEKENIKGIEYTVLRGKLSYRPTCCPKCGIVNENYDITKNGSQTVKILFYRVNTNPMILMIKKQRFFCKHCESTFMAKTPIVDKGCFIFEYFNSYPLKVRKRVEYVTKDIYKNRHFKNMTIQMLW